MGLANSLAQVQSLALGSPVANDKVFSLCLSLCFFDSTHIAAIAKSGQNRTSCYRRPCSWLHYAGYDIELWVRTHLPLRWWMVADLLIAWKAWYLSIRKCQRIHSWSLAILGKGALLQAKAFKEGFSKVFPITICEHFLRTNWLCFLAILTKTGAWRVS